MLGGANPHGGETMSTIARRITVADYERMIESGELPEDPHVELIEGRLVRKMTKGRGHSAGALYKAREAIERVLPAGWHARAERWCGSRERNSMPEPDVSVVRGEADDYLDLDPGPDDVGLLVEVADSSVAEDRALAGDVCRRWHRGVLDRQRGRSLRRGPCGSRRRGLSLASGLA